MKKLLSILFLIYYGNSFGQGFPSNPTQGNPNTKNIVMGAWEARKGMVVGVYSDTSSANSDTYTKGVPYITITTTSGGNVLWQRNSTATQWVQMSGGGGGGVPVTRIWLDSLRRAVGTDSIYEYFSSYAGVDGRRFAFKTSEAGGSDSTAYVNGLVVNDSTLRLYRFNGDSSDFEILGNGNGRYLKLTGTDGDGLMTGAVDFYDGARTTVNIKPGDGDESGKITFTGNNPTLEDNSTFYDVSGIFWDFEGGASQTSFLSNEDSKDAITIFSNVSGFKGLQGLAYYGANYNDSTFVQKKYVDSVAALGGTTIDETIVATGGQTAFTFTSVPADYANYLIFINGAEIENTTYFTTSGNIVTFTSGLVAGDRVRYRRIK